jgi:hypothetical protein
MKDLFYISGFVLFKIITCTIILSVLLVVLVISLMGGYR